MICSKCGCENADTAKFCRMCGTSMSIDAPKEETSPEKETENNNVQHIETPVSASLSQPEVSPLQNAPITTEERSNGVSGNEITAAYTAETQTEAPVMPYQDAPAAACNETPQNTYGDSPACSPAPAVSPVEEAPPAQFTEPQAAYTPPVYAQPTYAQPSYAQPAYAQPTYAQPTYAQPAYGVPAQRNGDVLVKKSARSPLFLVAISVFTIAVIMQLVVIFMTNGALESNFGKIEFSFERLGYLIENLEYYGDTIFVVFDMLMASVIIPLFIPMALCSLIPVFLKMLGLWLTFGAGFRKRQGMSTAGLTILQVLNIIAMIGTVTCAVFFTLICLLALIVAEEAIGFVLTVLIIEVVYFVLMIVYQGKVNSTIAAAKQTVTTGVVSTKISSYVAIFDFVCTLFTLVFTTVFVFAMDFVEKAMSELGSNLGRVLIYCDWGMIPVMAFVVSVLFALATILFGAVLLSHRNKALMATPVGNSFYA